MSHEASEVVGRRAPGLQAPEVLRTGLMSEEMTGRSLCRDVAVLRRIERRLLWLAVRMVDVANHGRDEAGAKVGGHQASSASLVTIMTALWFGFLGERDRVSVKPHASPVLHAISYLTGDLDAERLTGFRRRGGLQAYPSRTKDPDRVDFSTGSVGLGAVAPLFGAVVARYVACHFGEQPTRRFVSLVGDAELDEGNVWEAIQDPVTAGLDNVIWVVDMNRQSLDRVVPGIKARQWAALFAGSGWQVEEAKYGARLQALFRAPQGGALRELLDELANEEYQSLCLLEGAQLRSRFEDVAPREACRALEAVPDPELQGVVRDLGGHDFAEIFRCLDAADAAGRPTVVLAYTIKGWSLPTAADTMNHAALLNERQIDQLRVACGIDPGAEWARLDPAAPEGVVCASRSGYLRRAGSTVHGIVDVPSSVGVTTAKPVSTQETFGRLVSALGRTDELAPRLVTTSPDVTISTNLGGWVNKTGVFAPVAHERRDERGQLRWKEGPAGQHIELGISEMNLFLLLGQLGLSGDLLGEPLVPIGTVYDPFVLRGLDAFLYSAYSGARFIVAGTPAGVTLSYEGGAHQSFMTPSIGTELPNVVFAEPAYAQALDWLLCDGVRSVLDPAGESLYLRLSTRQLDQSPFEAATARAGSERTRRDVLAGCYCLVDGHDAAPAGAPPVHVFASGAVMPEALEAAAELAAEGVAASVLDVTSADRLFRDWRGTLAPGIGDAGEPSAVAHLRRVSRALDRGAPIVTVVDASPHGLAWLGSALGTVQVPLGVDGFGQSGSRADLYRVHEIDTPSIVNAALLALHLSSVG